MIAHEIVALEETDCNRKQGPCSTGVQWPACLPSKQEVRVRIPCIAPYAVIVQLAECRSPKPKIWVRTPQPCQYIDLS